MSSDAVGVLALVAVLVNRGQRIAPAENRPRDRATDHSRRATEQEGGPEAGEVGVAVARDVVRVHRADERREGGRAEDREQARELVVLGGGRVGADAGL